MTNLLMLPPEEMGLVIICWCGGVRFLRVPLSYWIALSWSPRVLLRPQPFHVNRVYGELGLTPLTLCPSG